MWNHGDFSDKQFYFYENTSAWDPIYLAKRVVFSTDVRDLAQARRHDAFLPVPSDDIDESKQFVPLKIAVLTVSDTRVAADDKSGATLAERIEKAGHGVAARAIVQDDVEQIRAQIRTWIADPDIDVIISTGGTGFTGRDVTPEAIRGIMRVEIPGFGEVMRARSLAITPNAITVKIHAGTCGISACTDKPQNKYATDGISR